MKPKKKIVNTPAQKVSLVVHSEETGSFIWQPPPRVAESLSLKKENLQGLTTDEIKIAEFGAECLREDIKHIIGMQLMHIGQIILLAASYKGRPLDAPKLLCKISGHITQEMAKLTAEFRDR